ncbi:MAG TPA: glycerate-2-kinase family protein, partial [Gemmatimonadales bacterium]|nr:glycerate-2-kinase family protein [Gemmatimonadales bacterium]
MKSPTTIPDARDLLLDLYSAATAAAAPGPALQARLLRLPEDPKRRIWIFALGKAALPMASTAVGVLQPDRGRLAGGVIVAPDGTTSPHPRLTLALGDHPEPGSRSLLAAEAVADTAARVKPDDEVWVLLSGGTTSLIGAPERGLTPANLQSLYSVLLGSGLDITAMNQIRKRFSRWGAGRLARALYPALVRVYIVSDVIGDDLPSIGSGPCVPDPTTAGDIRVLLQRAALWPKIPEAARRMILSVESGETAETPKPGDQAFARVTL